MIRMGFTLTGTPEARGFELGWVGLCRLRPSCILNSQKKKTEIGGFYFTHLNGGFFLSLDFIFIFIIYI